MQDQYKSSEARIEMVPYCIRLQFKILQLKIQDMGASAKVFPHCPPSGPKS